MTASPPGSPEFDCVKQAVRAGNQLLVFHSEDRYGPYCTAMLKSRKKRCRTSLLMSLGSGWEEVRIQGADGSVTIPGANPAHDECWIKQRCPEHLNAENAAASPDWTFFDLTQDADLIYHVGQFWTPQGVTGRRGLDFLSRASQANPAAEDTSPEPAEDERANMLARALASAVEPDASTALYRWFDDRDRLLYVGISDAMLARVQSHILASSWMDFAARATIVRYATRREAAEAETAAIKDEQPLFNDIHNRTPEAKARLVEYLIEHGRADLLAPAVSRG